MNLGHLNNNAGCSFFSLVQITQQYLNHESSLIFATIFSCNVTGTNTHMHWWLVSYHCVWESEAEHVFSAVVSYLYCGYDWRAADTSVLASVGSARPPDTCAHQYPNFLVVPRVLLIFVTLLSASNLSNGLVLVFESFNPFTMPSFVLFNT